MIDLTRTTSALLDSLREPGNDRAWGELDARYRPILHNLALRAGLTHEDAADAAQDALADAFRAYTGQRYDRSRGRLRAWLIGIAKKKFIDMQRRRVVMPGTLDTALSADADDAAWAQAWEAEQRATILREAMEQLRASEKLEGRNLEAFELTAVQRVPAAEAAERLGMSAQEVYLAKSRGLERLRVLIERLEATYHDA